MASVPGPLEPLYWFNLGILLLVSLLVWLAKRLVRTLDALRARIHNLELDMVRVSDDMAYITKTDRRKRLKDYYPDEDGD